MDTTDNADGLLRLVLVLLAVLLLAPLVMMVLAIPVMGMMWTGMMPVWGLGGMVLWLLVLVAVGYVLYRGLVGRGGAGGPEDPALEELRLAYARGDISDQEFDERRERLRSDERLAEE